MDDYIKIIKRLENQTLPKISEGSKQNEHHAVESEMKTGHLNSNKISFPNIKNKGVQVPIEELKKVSTPTNISTGLDPLMTNTERS